ncbi:MAG: DUF6094 domain-containing protein [Deferribacteraceae bacterium]|jgi:16S rRNA G966 N2-methylase RsmD|nr:DUF6094 domain-containing protein [Deferribacteraceae bacterium]
MRLAGQAKAGFFPTPSEVMEQILNIVNIQGNCRILDTCAGEGFALRDFKEKYPNVLTYGVELDNNRFQSVKTNADHCLCCDSITEFRATNDSFDVLFLNPPYDYGTGNLEDGTKAQRLEVKFLLTHLKYLAVNGLLIYVIPISVLDKAAPILSRLNDLALFPFPEPHYNAFKQVVVMGYKGKDAMSSAAKETGEYARNMRKLSQPNISALPTTADAGVSYTVEPCGVELKTFYTSRVNPDEAFKLVQKSILNDNFKRLVTLSEISYFEPLMPLNQSHLAILIVSGMIDGIVQSPDGDEWLAVKGNTRSENKTIETENDVRLRKVYEIGVRAFDLNHAIFFDIAA